MIGEAMKRLRAPPPNLPIGEITPETTSEEVASIHLRP